MPAIEKMIAGMARSYGRIVLMPGTMAKIIISSEFLEIEWSFETEK